MTELDVGKTTLTDLAGTVQDLAVDAYTPDTAGDQKETTYINPNYHKQLGYFKGIPEVNRAITALSTWTAGKGFTTDNATQAILDNINGWGEENFAQIMMNMQNLKKIAGDAFAEIIRNEAGILINLKILGGDSIRTVANKQGIILRYEQVTRTGNTETVRIISTEKMLHMCNERLADEIHGTSIIDIVEWVILARKEAMADWKRISHRSTIRVLYIDADDTSKLTKVKNEYADAINQGELMIIPAKKGEAEFAELTLPPIDAFMRWIQYLETVFYQIIGVPRVIATSENFTESGAKVGFLTFEPVYTKEQMLMEGDLWNQLAIRIKFRRPPSLGGDLNRDEDKDTGQLGFQPNDTKATINTE